MTIVSFADAKPGCGPAESRWLTLPVAPQAMARSRFSGENKLAKAVPLNGVLTWIADLKTGGTVIAGLDIDGPGEPLATVPMIMEVLSRLRSSFPELPLGITTLGPGLAEQAMRLAEQGVSRVTLLVDTLNPATVRQLYAWVRPGKRTMSLVEAADILIDEQRRAVASCRAAGIAVRVRTTVYAGINEQEVAKIAEHYAGLGVQSLSLAAGSGWLSENEELARPSAAILAGLAEKSRRYMANVCCVGEGNADRLASLSCGKEAAAVPKPTGERPRAAVLSSSGMDIDLHLGQAEKALIYGPRQDGLACLLEVRELPAAGGGDDRWLQLAGVLDDCFVLLAASAGLKPRQILSAHGLDLLLMEDTIEGTVDVLFGGGKKGKCGKG